MDLPLSANEWNSLLDMCNGTQIVRLLEPYQARSLQLQPARMDLELRLTLAMRGICPDITVRRVLIFSERAANVGLDYLFGSLPFWPRLDDLSDAFAKRLRWDEGRFGVHELWAEDSFRWWKSFLEMSVWSVEPELGKDRLTLLHQGVRRNLKPIQFRSQLFGHGTDRCNYTMFHSLQDTMEQALAFQACLLCLNWQEAAAKMGALIELFLLGNIPWGWLDREDVLVVYTA